MYPKHLLGSHAFYAYVQLICVLLVVAYILAYTLAPPPVLY